MMQEGHGEVETLCENREQSISVGKDKNVTGARTFRQPLKAMPTAWEGSLIHRAESREFKSVIIYGT